MTGTHCVGYATVLNAICNYALSVNHKKTKCFYVVGTVKVYGLDLCKVVSKYRIKNVNRGLWKVVVHEFIRANYNYGHCPKDDPKCIMKDAKGHTDFSNKNDLCNYCKKHI